jgi:hypothetical protein
MREVGLLRADDSLRVVLLVLTLDARCTNDSVRAAQAGACARVALPAPNALALCAGFASRAVRV